MFTWIQLYQEIARHVLTLEDQQDELISVLKNLREQSLPVITLTDVEQGGKKIELKEIDPFTFFASFNRGQRFDNRQKILESLKLQWGLQSDIPSEFEGIPVVDNRQSWFFRYAGERNQTDIPALWRLAHEVMEKHPSNFDHQVLDDCLANPMGSLPKLTMGMFWLNPYNYLAVDSRNREFLTQHGIKLESRSSDDYFRLLEEVTAKFDKDFPSISYEAYLFTVAKEKGGKTDPPSNESKQRFWTLSAGEGGHRWQEFLDQGIIAINLREISDLRNLKTQEELHQELLRIFPDEGNKRNDTLAGWQFVHEMKVGDIVFAKQGLSKLLGCGRVTGDYRFDPTRTSYRHIRKVEWLSTGGPWALPEDSRVASKTLTDITPYEGFAETLARIAGVDLDTLGGLVPPSTPTSPDSAIRNYWWLNANPKIWNFEERAVGTTQTYTSHNEKGNKRQKYKYFGEVKPGDLVIGYVTSPQKEVVAICEITKGLYSTKDNELIEFKKIEQLKNPISYEELKTNPALLQSEPLINNQGSLFKLNEDEYDIIRAIIDDANPITSPVPLAPYTMLDALSEVFLSEEELKQIISRLRRKKNIILQGPPGVGKTFVAKRLAYLKMGVKDSSRVEMVQFHQSYAYEDFIQGYRPNEQGTFTIKSGIFYEFCRKAQRDSGRDHFFIIDEINRGNLSKIFGEVMMLIEHDKRGADFAIPLTYATSLDERFYIPDNLYLIGTMNTADRSLSLVDYALRRRFAFVALHPKFQSSRFAETLRSAGVPPELIEKIQERVGALNGVIASDDRNLGAGYCIGHSYFCPSDEHTALNEAWYKEIIESEIRPLLEEYWVDESSKVEEQVNHLLA